MIMRHHTQQDRLSSLFTTLGFVWTIHLFLLLERALAEQHFVFSENVKNWLDTLSFIFILGTTRGVFEEPLRWKEVARPE